MDKLSPILQDYLQSPFCPEPRYLFLTDSNKTREEGRLRSLSLLLKAYRQSPVNITTLTPSAAGFISDLQPCAWETLKITHASVQLYRFMPEVSHKIRLHVSFDSEVDVYTDEQAYSLLALLNNCFGFLGLYLGIGVMEVISIMEKLPILLRKERPEE